MHPEVSKVSSVPRPGGRNENFVRDGPRKFAGVTPIKMCNPELPAPGLKSKVGGGAEERDTRSVRRDGCAPGVFEDLSRSASNNRDIPQAHPGEGCRRRDCCLASLRELLLLERYAQA